MDWIAWNLHKQVKIKDKKGKKVLYEGHMLGQAGWENIKSSVRMHRPYLPVSPDPKPNI